MTAKKKPPNPLYRLVIIGSKSLLYGNLRPYQLILTRAVHRLIRDVRHATTSEHERDSNSNHGAGQTADYWWTG